MEDRFGELSKRLDAFETKQRDSRVTLGTSPRDGGLDLFGNHEEVRFSELPAPLSPSPYQQLPQQKEKPRVRPSLYNGSTLWEDYHAQFELVAEINGWDRRTKAAYLAVSLSGPAQAVLGDLDKTQRTSYTDLVAALDSRFGTSNRTEMFRVSLRSRTRKPAETLPELAQAIRRLTRQAYPDAPISLRESIAKDQFIEALTDPELRWKVHQAKATSLTEALDAAVEVEAFFSAEKQRGSGTKILQAVTTQSPTPEDSTLKQELHELKTLVHGLVQQPRGTSDLAQRGWQRTWNSPECWACGAQGHIQRYCPKRFGNGLRTPSGRPCGDCRYCDRVEQKGDTTSVADSGSADVLPCCAPQTLDKPTEGCSLSSPQPDPKPPPENQQFPSESFRPKKAFVVTGSRSDLRACQVADDDLGKIIAWKKSCPSHPAWKDVSTENKSIKTYWSQWERLSLRNGVLCRQWESEAGDEVRWQLVMPSSLRNDVLQELHTEETAGHLGVNKTLGRVKERFYWPRCTKDVKDWCRACDLCASRERPTRTPRAPLQTYNVGAPLERVALDIMGPLPESDRGNKYILVIGDYFSKWTEAFAIPNQEATTVARVLVEEFVARFGIPRQIHSDQGRNFESKVFQEMCEALGMDKTRTTPLHPQSDGMIERFNRTLEGM